MTREEYIVVYILQVCSILRRPNITETLALMT